VYILYLSISIPVCICITNCISKFFICTSIPTSTHLHVPCIYQFFAIHVPVLIYNVLINWIYFASSPFANLHTSRLHLRTCPTYPPTNPSMAFWRPSYLQLYGTMPSDAEVSAARAKLAAMRQSLAGLKQHQASGRWCWPCFIIVNPTAPLGLRIVWGYIQRERERETDIYIIIYIIIYIVYILYNIYVVYIYI